MPKSLARTLAILIGIAALVAPARARAQSAPAFGEEALDVTSEWTGQDRGDGSGSYHLITRVTDSRTGTTIQHELVANRSVELEVESSESLSVLEGDTEKAHAESDPSALGHWAEPAVAYVIPFDADFNSDPRKTYRPRDRQVADIVKSAAPDARVSSRAASDGRTTAVVEIPAVMPIAELTQQFVGIRKAFQDADVGLAKLQIKGHATTTSVSAEAASAQ
jgi:hypothetical protein